MNTQEIFKRSYEAVFYSTKDGIVRLGAMQETYWKQVTVWQGIKAPKGRRNHGEAKKRKARLP